MAGGWFQAREHITGQPKPFANFPRTLVGTWLVLCGGLVVYYTATWVF